MNRFLLIFLLLSMFACKQNQEKEVKQEKEAISTAIYNEKFRPQFHFSPQSKWMNDPNGMVFYKGIYHLFYQYYPEDIVWGPMHWGHAVSEDLIQWEHKPIALYPDSLGYIFSGSTVVDFENTSGFGTTENPPLVAIYTYHDIEGERAKRKDFQTQGIAYSLDNGDSWIKYDANPVIGNKNIKDFRDPKVMWHDESSQWIMTLVAGDHAKFYGSEDLKKWNLLSEFGKDKGAHGGVWECPDLFKIKVKGSEEEKWVLFISINPGAPNGGSGTQYFIGDFDGKKFTAEQKNEWLDYGRDNYAGVTYSNAPNGDHTFIGWMSNWDYAQITPTEIWRSAMTLPRNIELVKEQTGYFLKSYPVSNLKSISRELLVEEKIELDKKYKLTNENFNNLDLVFSAKLSDAIRLILSNEKGENVVFEVNTVENELWFDRTESGLVAFEPRFAGTVQKQSYQENENLIEFRFITDESLIEIFIDQGRYIFTNQIFPSMPYTNLEIQGKDGVSISNFSINKLSSIWSNHE
ncbi:glycoside hydrolase family 32 protein [Saprospiraceae bacterium]|nr:glycoside hydrolase family 32 protein [Saprospiraceae bacterium]